MLASAGRGMVFRATVSDRDLVRIRAGDAATVRLDAYPAREWRAQVVERGAAPSPLTGAYSVTLSLPEASGLPTGLVGRATLAVQGGAPVRLVPVEALVEGIGSEGTVFVLDADGTTARRRVVTIAFVGTDRLGVSAGLDGADVVVTQGAPYLEDGDTVRVVP
jgi:multidrug efflux pump subunit AcrA (membrane-fusion protein)